MIRLHEVVNIDRAKLKMGFHVIPQKRERLRLIRAVVQHLGDKLPGRCAIRERVGAHGIRLQPGIEIGRCLVAEALEFFRSVLLQEIGEVDLAYTVWAGERHEVHVDRFPIQARCGVEGAFQTSLALLIIVTNNDALGMAGPLEKPRVTRLGKARRDRADRWDVRLQGDKTICDTLSHKAVSWTQICIYGGSGRMMPYIIVRSPRC
jgi:hypothetical protein